MRMRESEGRKEGVCDGRGEAPELTKVIDMS